VTYTATNESYTVVVGAQGTGGVESTSTAAVAGNPSSIALGVTKKVEANGGGAGPSNNTTAGNGGSAGTVSVGAGFDGGKGGAGGGGTGAAGGSSAGTGQIGASGTDGSGTAPATRTGGGAAGAGSGGAVGGAGRQPGGGGGGGGDANGGDGGAGGTGLVIISYKLRPTILSATLDYGTGLLVVLMSEAVSATANVDGTKFHVNNVTGANVVTLTNPEVTSVNAGAKTVTFTLTGLI